MCDTIILGYEKIIFTDYQDLMRRIREQEETEAVADESAEKSTKEKLYEAFKELIVLLETPEMRKRSYLSPTNAFSSWRQLSLSEP